MKAAFITIGVAIILMILLRISFNTVDADASRHGMKSAYELGKLNYSAAMKMHIIDVAMGVYPAFNVNVVDRLVDSMEQADPQVYEYLTKPK